MKVNQTLGEQVGLGIRQSAGDQPGEMQGATMAFVDKRSVGGATPNLPRVLMLLENAPFLLDSRVYPEATTLAAAGYQVAVICPATLNEPWHAEVEGVQVYRFSTLFNGTGLLGYLWEYGVALVATFVLSLVVLLRHGFDVIHAHNPPDTGVLIALFYKLLGKRFVYDQHDLAPEMYTTLFKGGKPWVHRILIWLEQLSSRQADRIVVTNESHQRMIVQRSSVPVERITVVRNGPKADVIRWVEPAPELRKPGKVTLCYVGVMGYHDGVDCLLRSLYHLVYGLERTDFHCILVGAGNAWEMMKALSVELQLEEYVTFVGWVYPQEVSRYLSAADICLAPEPSNAYNDRCTIIKIAEYMALGKPVVAFDLPEHRVTAQGTALYAEPNRVESFAAQIVTLMDDPALCQRMGEMGRVRVEKELAWPHQGKRLLHVYHSLTETVPRLA